MPGESAVHMLRVLLCLNLTLTAGLLALVGVLWTTDLYESARWWQAAKANEGEWRTCESKHDMLKRAIQREGLWKRLGMPSQPWLR